MVFLQYMYIMNKHNKTTNILMCKTYIFTSYMYTQNVQLPKSLAYEVCKPQHIPACPFTQAVAVVILDPPAAPTTILTSPRPSTNTDGHMDDSGRLPGSILLAGEGGIPKSLGLSDVAKSSISSFQMMPVRFPNTSDPNLHKQIINTSIKEQ